MKVLALARYGSAAASTRQRMLQYVPHLNAAGIEVDFHPLLGSDYVAGLAEGTRVYSRARIARRYLGRISQLVRRADHDALWVYAELFPYLPAAFERLALFHRKPIVYDMDDAFFHQYDSHGRSMVRRLLGRKLQPLLRGAAACCCGNAYLYDYAHRYCPNSMILPTVVDTDAYVPVPAGRDASSSVTIGWIGSPSTWVLLEPHMEMLADLCRSEGASLRIVGAGAGARKHNFEGLTLVDWSEETEIAEVQAMDIGIMPVWDGPFQRGKSGYKLIQYMACGLPVVASPVGVNSEIVRHGENGFLVSSEAEWREALIRLIRDPSLRTTMGRSGRTRAETSYSLASQAPRLVEVFRSISNSL